MSAKFAMSYCRCGEPIKRQNDYCWKCNTRYPVDSADETDGEDGEDVGDVGDDVGLIARAVRTNLGSESEEKREERFHQQKWTTFETNYQREKGITTEESLRELEEFADEDGAVPEPAPHRKPTAGGKFRETLTDAIDEHEEKEREKEERKKNGGKNLFKRLSGSFKARGSGKNAAAAGPDAPRGMGGRKPSAAAADFVSKARGSTTGAEFFAKFQAKEKAKFRPTFGM